MAQLLPKKRLLVFVVAYNAEKTIESVLTRIPQTLGEDYDVEILVIDDASHDQTFERGEITRRGDRLPFSLHVLFNPRNQGYGGNQKIGFTYAIENGFDFVALVHGDGQYAPEYLPELLGPLAAGEADAVFGSRMLRGYDALKGGMPLYKFVGNKILTWTQNRLLGTRLSEFHSGYRIYSVGALRRLPFQRNTNVFHFDTEIIIQLVFGGFRIRELPIPTYYGDEICNVDGFKYAWDVFTTTLKARMQQFSLYYDRKFDCRPCGPSNRHYQIKLGYTSPHSLVLDRVKPGTRVLDLGCAGGYLGAALQTKGCKVTGMDVMPLTPDIKLDDFRIHDLNAPLSLDAREFDYILLMDVVEHLASPEDFVDQLFRAAQGSERVEILVSTGNVAFIVVRLMLMLGQFNYGKRGILDLTHTRLFTARTLRQLFMQAGFDVVEQRGVPAPFPLAVGNGVLGLILVRVNEWLIRLSTSLFAYQVFMVLRPTPTLESLLKDAMDSSLTRAASLDHSAGAPAVARTVAKR